MRHISSHQNRRLDSGTGFEFRKLVLLTTAVSSKVLSRLARLYREQRLDICYEETLEEGFQVLFTYEEALSYMFPSISFDKDGIAAASIFIRAVEYWGDCDNPAGCMSPRGKA